MLMVNCMDEIEEIEGRMIEINDKENMGDTRNKRFLLGEFKLKCNRLWEEYNTLER